MRHYNMKRKVEEIDRSGFLYDRFLSMFQKSKIIGKGAYGCVVQPPIKSNIKETYIEYNDIKRNDVGKLFKNTSTNREDFMAELDNIELTNLFDANGIFTVKTKGANLLKSENIDNQIRNCLEVSYHNEYVYQIILENGGVPLYQMKDRSLSFQKFVRLMKTFIEGFTKMQEFGLCHRDIKPDNILISDDKISLIDFGVSDELTNVYSVESQRVLSHKSKIYPPEFYIASILLEFKSNKNQFQEVLDDVIPLMENDGYFETLFQEKHIDTVKQEINNFISTIKKSNYDYSDVFNVDMAKKCDIYSLFSIFEEMSQKVIIVNNIQQRQLKTLVIMCQEPNPYERGSLQDIQDILNDMEETTETENSSMDGGKSRKNIKYIKLNNIYKKKADNDNKIQGYKSKSANIIKKKLKSKSKK